MFLQMTGITEQYITFSDDVDGVEYLGQMELTEFWVLNVSSRVIRIDKELKASTYSKFELKIVFRRLSVYHLLNIYLRTLLLVFTACITLFFDVSNFSDRIMVSLTVILVATTLITTFQASLPPTAYYKLIDGWLLFTLSIIIVIMIQHTTLAYMVKYEDTGGRKTKKSTLKVSQLNI